MIELERLRPQVEEILRGNQWVQWIHVQRGFTHCKDCLKLHGCCFVQNKAPLVGEDNHPHCHCYYKNIPPITAVAEADIRKFTEYAFVWSAINDKSQIFHSMGYSVRDSKWLKQEFMRQAKIKYEKGEYELTKKSEHGQRIKLEIILHNYITGQETKFYSGWIILPNGYIRLITPFTGWIK